MLLMKTNRLHLAAHKGHVDVVKVLIQNGADVNTVTENKWTALHHSAKHGHVDVVKVLSLIHISEPTRRS